MNNLPESNDDPPGLSRREREVMDAVYSVTQGTVTEIMASQIIGMQPEGFSRERLIAMAERAGIEILSLPSISTGPGMEAAIFIGDKVEDSLENDRAIEPAIHASVVPLIAEDGETIRLELLVSTVGSYVNPDTELDFRQVKLDDFEILEGGTAFVSGFTPDETETSRALFVFVTPEIRWP